MQNKPEDYIKAITEAQGLISVAARRLGCSRTAVYEAAKNHPEVQRAIDDARERTTDLAEGKLFQKINEGDNTAIIFYLKTQGKKTARRTKPSHCEQGPFQRACVRPQVRQDNPRA